MLGFRPATSPGRVGQHPAIDSRRHWPWPTWASAVPPVPNFTFLNVSDLLILQFFRVRCLRPRMEESVQRLLCERSRNFNLRLGEAMACVAAGQDVWTPSAS